MRYFVITMVLLCGFSVRSSHAGLIFTCEPTLLNCTSGDFSFCSYNGNSLWDTLYAATIGTLDSGESKSPECTAKDECYVIGEETDVYICTEYQVDGFVGCSDYACVDGDVSLHTGSSEYCCVDDSCSTDCD